MRREEAEQTLTRNRRILSAARRLHRALVVGQGAPEDFYAAEAIFVRTVQNHLESSLQILHTYERSKGSAAARRAASEAKRILTGLKVRGLKTGFHASVSEDGKVNQNTLSSLLQIDQEVGSKLLLLSQILKQLRRRRSENSINHSLAEAEGILADLGEALARRTRFSTR